ncbi:LacI family DNA-binding transcriptional regulator [Ancylomarina longa]|uniref:LacI family transcriptional regulator n=1 Tax=Ancylomarina longa TaxID=2487017 RepID=A0A434AFY1_9BACT|nr:LacI family DNA-binding transcriptional regulator [Ancylomarina longa]RUT73274.1 LacI family transcriptional regulator [Ancylomarina longa]
MAQVTLRDIADHLSMSVSTISKALKGYADISKETRELILATAEEMNYIPNASAVNLRTKQTKTIGVIVPSTEHQFFSKVLSGIIDEAEKYGYLVIILQSNENYNTEKQQLQLLKQNRVDGILISLSNETHRFEHIEKLMKEDIALVLFDKTTKLLPCSKVAIDDRQAAYSAVECLLKKGYKRIAHFRGPHIPQLSIDRFLGYKQALIDYGIPFDPSLVYVCDNNDDFKDGYENARLLVQEHKDVDAIFTITDVVAVGVMKYFKDVKISIPDDIALFGFSNWFMASVVTPSLSTVDQPTFEMGKTAAKILFEEIKALKNKVKIEPREIILPTSLKIRESI